MIGYLLLSEKYYVAFVICKGFEAAFLSFPRNQIALKNEGVEFQCSTDLHNVSLRWYVNYAGSRDRMKIIVVVTILIVADRRPESTTSSSSIALFDRTITQFEGQYTVCEGVRYEDGESSKEGIV